MGTPTRPHYSAAFGFVGVAVLAVIVVLVVGRGGTFFQDEWDYIHGASLGDPASWFRAHNEHWVTLHVVAYRMLYETFGETSYVPYLLGLMAVHVSAAAALFVLVGQSCGGWAPLAASTLFLFLGSGYFNLFWGFQIGMVGALSLGLWALVFVPSRPWLAALLLTASVATHGNGLFVACGAVTYAWLVRPWAVSLLVIPFAAFAAWWLVFGADSARIPGEALAPDPGLFLRFPIVGLASWLGGVAGVGVQVGLGLIVAAPIVLWYNRDTLQSIALASLAVIGAQVVALSLTRALVTPADESRYVYLAAPFILMIVAGLRLPAKRALFAWALGVNIAMLVYWGTVWTTTRPHGVLA